MFAAHLFVRKLLLVSIKLFIKTACEYGKFGQFCPLVWQQVINLAN